MGIGIFGNSEDFELSPDNSEELEPGQESEDESGAGPEQGEPENGQTQSPSNEPSGEPTQQEGELILGKFKSTEALAKAYQELEKRLGSQAQTQTQTQQVPPWMQAIFGGQAPMAPPGAPQASTVPPAGWWGPQGPYNVPQPQMPVPQGPAWMSPGAMAPQPAWMPPGYAPPQNGFKPSDGGSDEPDPNKWLEEFYEKGPQAVDARVEKKARKIVEEMINEAAMQYIAPMSQSIQTIQEFVNTEATRRAFANLLQAAAKGKDDFNDLRQDMEAILQEQPHLVYMASVGQNPYEIAYQEAKRRRELAKQQEEQTTAEKKGAKMPRPNAANRQEPQPQDAERAYVANIFGLDAQGRSAQGIFGLSD